MKYNLCDDFTLPCPDIYTNKQGIFMRHITETDNIFVREPLYHFLSEFLISCCDNEQKLYLCYFITLRHKDIAYYRLCKN